MNPAIMLNAIITTAVETLIAKNVREADTSYTNIDKFFRYLGSNHFLAVWMIEEARQDKAPFDVVYKDIDGRWIRIDDLDPGVREWMKLQ